MTATLTQGILAIHRSDVARLAGKWEAGAAIAEGRAKLDCLSHTARGAEADRAQLIREFIADLDALPREPVETMALTKAVAS